MRAEDKLISKLKLLAVGAFLIQVLMVAVKFLGLTSRSWWLTFTPFYVVFVLFLLVVGVFIFAGKIK